METVDNVRGRMENAQSAVLTSIPFCYASSGESALLPSFYGGRRAPAFLQQNLHSEAFLPMQHPYFACASDLFKRQNMIQSVPFDCYGRRLWQNSRGMEGTFGGVHTAGAFIRPMMHSGGVYSSTPSEYGYWWDSSVAHCGPKLAANTMMETRDEYHQLNHFKQADFEYIYRAVASDDSPSIANSVDGMSSHQDVHIKLESTNFVGVEDDSSIYTKSECHGIEVEKVSYAESAEKSLVTDKENFTGTKHSLRQTHSVKRARSHKDCKSTSREGMSIVLTDSSLKRPNKKDCEFPGCHSRARLHQRCKKHGGAHQCAFSGCTKNSQSRGLCIAHGGGSRCKVDGCTRASQSKGLCKSHGGGENCAVSGCIKKAHLKHLCRNHGGGIRCKQTQCSKWAQRKGWCMAHAKKHLGS
uniref:Uncharacterized protein AlNc14C92G5750 n=1 Tax=Albugo laibachii Nc14 TaxID=890382 RepID=F0WGM2_9STRA|nr:conserved hypothetical protein [Albugo laibachii Nc14]|eukprot:CCA20386.1 conserved hypothetical protein [Albugo laibachii Nc14]